MTDPDAEARRELARHRAFATSLLVLMGALTLASYALPQGWWPDLLQAATKAGFIGGIADWFAVTALFRHPLGLPIPHTAIIPNHKERLGRALGRFVATHVFTGQEVAGVLRRLDLPGILHRFLADPVAAHPAALALAETLPKLLSTVEDGRARRLIARLVPRLMGGPGAGRLVARALASLVEGGRHQEVLSFVLAELKTLLARREDALRTAIEERVREQGGRLVGWALGASVARRVLATINGELDKVSPDGSELRAAFDEWVRREIARMEEDPDRAAEIGLAVRRVVAHRDGAGLAVGRLGPAADGAGGRCRTSVRPHRGLSGGRAGQPGCTAGKRSRRPGAGADRRRGPRRFAAPHRPDFGYRTSSPKWWPAGTPRPSPSGWNCASARICSSYG